MKRPSLLKCARQFKRYNANKNRYGLRVALLSTVCFLVSVSYVQEAFAQVDARRELLKVQAQYAQYLQEEQDYTARTQEHMNSAIETLLSTWGDRCFETELKGRRRGGRPHH